MRDTDCLSKFLLQDRSARVISVQIEQTWQTAQVNQVDFPAVRDLLGELIVAATLLTANLKFDGSLLLQLRGNGVVKLIVVECRQDLSLRATIKLHQDPSQDQVGLQALLNADGQGRFSVILNPPKDNPGRQPYQGIVPLTGESVSEVLQNYMWQSEQLETRIWLAASPQRLGGLLLQRMPLDGGHALEPLESTHSGWDHAQALCDTIDPQELTEVSSDTLLHRLFWQTPVVSLEALPISWRCGCTRTRVSDMLRTLGATEIDSIIAEQGQVEVICEFCGTPYHFDSVDAAALFKALSPIESQHLQ